MNSSLVPLYTLTKIGVVIDGRAKLIGYQFTHRNPLITALVSAPLRVHFECNRFFHNRRYPIART